MTTERDNHLQQARTAMSEGRFDCALKSLTAALTLAPSNAEALSLALELGERQEQTRLDRIEKTTAQPTASNNSPPIIAATKRESTIALAEDELHAILLTARRYVERGRFETALEEVNAGLLIDSANPELLWLRNTISEQMQAKPAIEPKRTDYLKAARQHLRASRFDEALHEIAHGILASPDNQDLKALENEIWKLKDAFIEERRQDEAEAIRQQRHARITILLVAAEEFTIHGKFARALDEIAHAYAIDPLNPETRQLEIRVRQQQQRSIAPQLKLVYNQAS